MLIDLKNLAEGKFASIDLRTEIKNDDLTESLQEYKLLQAPVFSGSLTAAGDGVYNLTGQLLVIVQGRCARCLADVPLHLELDVVETYRPQTAEEEEDDGYTYTGNELDLEVALWDNLVLALPAKLLCKENCRGLCPACGQNLNEKDCKCNNSEIEADNPFAQLKKLL